MTLAHPALNTFSKKKTKFKYRNATEAKKAREAEELQKKIYSSWNISNDKQKSSKKEFVPNYTHRSTHTEISSVVSNLGGVCAKKESPQYTGDLIKGIAVMHKSCLQPVISKEQATESAQMRRG